jgi:hypothetical protein
MITAPIDYYILPFLCALLGALLGRLGRRKSRTAAAAGGVLIGLFAATAIEALWHDPRVFQAGYRAVILAMALAIAVPTVPTFGAAWIASGPHRGPSAWAIASGLTGLAGLAVYPVCAIYLYCEIAGLCL